MDVQKKLDEIVAAVEGARSMPMSASCVINRAELLSLLDEVRAALPDSLSQAQALLSDREQMVAEARQEAERIIESAHEQRGSLVSHTEIALRSQEEADRILAEARREADEIRAEADEYVDSKLANFEVVLTKTLGAVDRGREKLLGRAPAPDAHGGYPQDDPEAPERSSDPAELRRRADEYVDTKLGSFEAVLAKTLEAVGRGRQKLTGHRPTDELAEHLAAQDGQAADGGAVARQSDAEYLAGLADHQEQPGEAVAYSGGYVQQPEYEPAADYGYQQDPYPGGYADPYAAQQGYGGQPEYDQGGQGYGWQQQGYQQPGYGHQAPHQVQPEQPQHGYVPHQSAGLDETSFFDTGLIDLERLRELDQGR